MENVRHVIDLRIGERNGRADLKKRECVGLFFGTLSKR